MELTSRANRLFEAILAGRLKPWQRWTGLLFVVVLAILLTRLDLHTRLLYRMNLYPILVLVAVILFREPGLLTIAGSLGLYHLVSLEHHWETRAMLVANLEQLFLNSLVGVLCLLVMRFYKQRLEEEERASLARRDTVDYVIHELRNPLFAARGLLYSADSTPQAAVVRSLLDGMDDLLEQLHDSHSPDRVIVPRTRPLPLDPLLKEVVTRFSELDNRHLYILEQTDPATVQADSKLVTRMVENLLGNAMRYAREGQVRLWVKPVDSGYSLIVEDEGPGVTQAEAEGIFERHQRGAAGVTGPPGLGIGLYLSRRYAEAQHGTLIVHPGPRGHFELWLPAPV